MPSRKRAPYRKWDLWEIEEVRRLHDKEGLGFPEIGRIMGIPGVKCRMIYHTGRKTDRVKRPSLDELRKQYDIPETLYRRIRDRIVDIGGSTHPINVLRSCLLREGKLTPEVDEMFQSWLA